MTMTVGARSLDNEERSNFRDYMSLLSLSVDASMTVREVMAVAYLIGRHDALRDVRNASSPARTVNRRLIHGGPSDCVFNRGYEAGAGMVSDEIDALMRDVEALSGDCCSWCSRWPVSACCCRSCVWQSASCFSWSVCWPPSRDQWGRADDAPHTRDRRRFRFRRVLSDDVRPVPRGHAPRHA